MDTCSILYPQISPPFILEHSGKKVGKPSARIYPSLYAKVTIQERNYKNGTYVGKPFYEVISYQM